MEKVRQKMHEEDVDAEFPFATGNGSWGDFEAIYERYWSKLYLSAYSLLRDKQACEDIVQEVMVEFWMKRKSHDIRSIPAYLHMAVRYQVYKALKAGGATISLPEDFELAAERIETEDRLTGMDLQLMFDKQISQLPEKCREVFVLSRVQYLSIKEISSRMQISTKTVENHLTNALRRLRAQLGEYLYWTIILLSAFF